MPRPYVDQDESRLEHLRSQHHHVAHHETGKYTLNKLFSNHTIDIMDYCRDFYVNPHALKSDQAVKEWALGLTIWHDDTGDHYNNMTAFLHPTPNYHRLTAIGKIYAFMFYMNDNIGREKLGHMTPQEIIEVRGIVDHIYELIHTGKLPANSGPIVQGAYESLEAVRQRADADWYRDLIEMMKDHLEPSYYDQNSRVQGQVLTVKEFVDRRLYISGMYITLALMEFGDNQYLPWAKLQDLGLVEDIKDLQWLCAAIGAIMNDIFSFEKEFIVDGSDFNLIPIMYLNNPEWSFHETIMKATNFVRNLVINFRDLEDKLYDILAGYEDSDPAMSLAVKTHMLSLRRSVQATWVWENYTERYKNEATIFYENTPQSTSIHA